MKRKWLFMGLLWAAVASVSILQPALTVFGSGAVYPALPPDRQKTFNISAINVDITINRWGDHIPSGMMYVLNEDIPAVKAQQALPLQQRAMLGLRDDPVQPLVIRANVGDLVTINFTNQLGTVPAVVLPPGITPAPAQPAGLTIHGLYFDPDTGYGANVGLNANTLVAPGQTATYTYFVPDIASAEGSYVFNTMGDPRGQGMLGLIGVLNVEPKGSTYLNPITGLPKNNGWESMIVDPNGKDFREDTIIYHEFGDETFAGIVSAAGGALPLNDPLGTYRPGSRDLNYRSEPFFRRQDFLKATNGFEDEALSYSSYAAGDPPTPFPRGYLGDPTKRRIVGGSERFHSEHLHSGSIRWPFDPTTVADNSGTADAGRWGNSWTTIGLPAAKHPPAQFVSQRLDVQSIGPLETYTEMMEGAAGGLQGFAGETLFHCHFGEHYVGGMWSFWRVYDTLQADQSLPDEPALAELPDRVGQTPAAVTSDALIGKALPGGKILTTGTTNATSMNIDEWMRSVLPPQGDPGPAAAWDASVWDWTTTTVGGLPRYMGEPETTVANNPNYKSLTPGVRPAILFNPKNMRPAFPLLRPHFKRPPFSPGRSGSPYLGGPAIDDNAPTDAAGKLLADPNHPDALIPSDATRRIEYVLDTEKVAITVNSAFNITNPAMALIMLDEDKAAILSGAKKQEQLTIRGDVGDGIDIFQYNSISDNPKFFPSQSKSNIHIHFVQFDTQASDGVISGFSYEQSARSYLDEGGALPVGVPAAPPVGPGIHLTANSAQGATSITVDNAANLKVNAFIGIGFGTPRRNGAATVTAANPSGTLNTNGGFEMAQIVAKNGNTLTLDRRLLNNHTTGQNVGVEFTREQWWVDAEESTTYFHNHVFSLIGFEIGLTGALVCEPETSLWVDPTDHNKSIRAGTIADILTSKSLLNGVAPQNFREYVLHEMAGMHGLTSANGGGQPGAFNMKQEPLTGNGRLAKNPDPSLAFSSVTHGDPQTPLLKAYVGDLAVIRLLNSAGHDDVSFALTGHRFRVDRYDPKEQPKSQLTTAIAERFDLVFTAGGVGMQAGDYPYMESNGEKLLDGAWGILRVMDKIQPDLVPIRAATPTGNSFPVNTVGGVAARPPVATEPNSADDVANVAALKAKLEKNGYALPPNMPVRTFNVVAIDKALQFAPTINVATGRMFVLAEDEAAVVAGTKPTEPLVIRANVGDIVRINFANHLNTSNARASFNVPELIKTPDSMGSAAGLNNDSTVPVGGTATYWYVVDPRFEVPRSFIINDMGDVVNGAASGLYGMFVVEPAGSTFFDAVTGAEVKSGAIVDVHNAGPAGSFRDAAIIFHDNDHVQNRDIMPYQKAVDVSKGNGINYRAAPFAARLAADAAIANVFKTEAQHGDPATPLVQAIAGDPVVFHMGQGFGQQAHTINVDGYSFAFEPSRPSGMRLYSRLLGPRGTIDMNVGVAGTVLGASGDFIYRDGRNAFLESGMWGILRVKSRTNATPGIKPLPAAAPVATVLGTPTGLKTTAVTSTSVSLSWTSVSNGAESGFMVQRATNDITFVNGLVELHTAAGITTLDDLTVNPNTVYMYRVQAVSAAPANSSVPSAAISVTTARSVAGLPPAPAAGGGGGGGGGTAPVVKHDVSLSGLGSVTGLSTDDSGKVVGDSQVKTANDDCVINLASGTRMVDNSGKPITSMAAKVSTAPPAPPAGGSILSAFTMEPSGAQFDPPIQVTMRFDPAKVPAGFDAKALHINFFDGAKWVELDSIVDDSANGKTVSAQVSHFTEFAVLAVPGAAVTPQPEAGGEAVTAAPSPTAPSGLTATFRAGAVVLTWQDNSSNEQLFMVERSTDKDFNANVAEFHLPANVTTLTDASVEAGKTYYYKVAATHELGVSESNVATVTIPGGSAGPGPGTPSTPSTPPASGPGPSTPATPAEQAPMNWGLIVGIGAGLVVVIAVIAVLIGSKKRAPKA